MIEQLTRQLRGDEGVRSCVYRDTLGFFSIGVGRLVDSRKPGAGLRPHEIDYLLGNDIADRVSELTRRIPWFADLDPVRSAVLLNMSFQLGVDGLLGFKATLRYVKVGDYERAAKNMLQSLWASQTPERAERMAEQMRTGRWQFAAGT